MKYMGSKSRIAKYIVPILQEQINKTGYDYLEPFCGGCNIIDKIVAKNRFAFDNNKYLIELWKHIVKNNDEEYPDKITREHYLEVKNNFENFEDWYIGYVGFLASYNGRFFDGGYAKTVVSKSGVVRNYYDEAKRNILKQSKNLKDVNFFCFDYRELNPKNMVIYCDPPYFGTTQYLTSKGFSHEEFWEIVKKWSELNIVYVSEETAPEDFEVIWEQEILRTQDNKTRKTASEKLFKLKTT